MTPGFSFVAFAQTDSSALLFLQFFFHVCWTLGKTDKNFCLFSFHFPRSLHTSLFWFSLETLKKVGKVYIFSN